MQLCGSQSQTKYDLSINLAESLLESLGEEKEKSMFLNWYVRTEETGRFSGQGWSLQEYLTSSTYIRIWAMYTC